MIDKSAEFSIDRKYRYVLRRIWNRKKWHVLFVCLNPSTADENVDDPTIRRCIRFADSWGYGGMVMCNLFAFRATDPKEMMACSDPVGSVNSFYWADEYENAEITIAAWGVNGAHQNMGKKFMRYIDNDIYCLALTKDGHPKHPLYLKKDLKPVLYRHGGKAC